MVLSLFRRKNKVQDQMFAPVQISCLEGDDGSITVSNQIDLYAKDETLIDALEAQARTNPDGPFLNERQGETWVSISYSEFLAAVRARAAKLLATGDLSADRPLLILAPNSIDHAISSFAAMYIGVPASPVSPAYGLMSGAHDRLEKIVSILEPGAVYLGDPDAFASAVPTLHRACRGAVYAARSADGVKAINELPRADEARLANSRNTLSPDTVAKIIFTSGSTGTPKGVINTHRMMCSNQRSLTQLWPFLLQKPPVLVDWLPWSHTFGGNVCMNIGLFTGATLYIDEGKPSPALFSNTVKNLKSVAPTLFLNVPAGIEALLPYLEDDRVFARHFFSRLDAVFVAAAALPQKARDRLKAVCLAATGKAPNLVAGWGSTETAPFATSVYYSTERADNIGLPMPGTSIKLSPDQDKLALAVRGPNVTPGYWNNEDATQTAFDADGFYHMGDAGAFVDPDRPEAGLRFDGRLSENFKLSSGTWVNVGMLRVNLIGKLTPLIKDAVLTGHNADDLGALLVLNPAAGAQFAHSAMSAGDLFANEAFRAELRDRLHKHNQENPGSSTKLKRLAVLTREPDLSRNEITDKGYINQRAMLENWSGLIGQLHSDGPETDLENLILRL